MKSEIKQIITPNESSDRFWNPDSEGIPISSDGFYERNTTPDNIGEETYENGRDDASDLYH